MPRELNHQFYKDLIDNVIGVFDPGVVSVYKFAEIVQDIYRQGVVTYSDPVDIDAVIRTQRDTEQIGPIGNTNENYIFVTIAVKELEEKFPDEEELQWITVKDVVVLRGLKYTVQEVRHAGSKFGSPTVVFITAREKPDLVLP